MTTDHERLQAWMDQNGCTIAHLQDKIHGTIRKGHIKPALQGKRPFTYHFKYEFARNFGAELAAEIFDLTQRELDNIGEGKWNIYEFHPKLAPSHTAVAKAIRTKQLRPASFHKCHGCNEQAQLYHHQSYLESDRLCIVPLCRSCHRRHHNGTRVLTFGVVPTSVGVVRIAIAGLIAPT